MYSLILKMVLEGTQEVIYFQQHVLFIDEETLVFDMPAMASAKFRYTRKATFYISLNQGVDWSPQSADFMFYEEPHMTKLSKTQVNLKAKVPLTIYGLYFRQDITFCMFDEEKVIPYEITPTQVSCMLFP